MKLKSKILALMLLVLTVTAANAQRIKATASLDSANVLLGDQVKLFLEIDHPADLPIEFPEVPDTLLQKIEVLGRSEIDTFEVDDETMQKQIRSFLITSFDSGFYRIPPFWFKIDVDGRMDSIPTNGVSFHVHSMPVDTTMGPTDIKLPYDAPVTLKEVIPYILGMILIAAILFFIFYAYSRRKNNKPLFVLPKKPKEPEHVIALRELDRIKDEKLWQKGKIKEYYSEVTEVLRKYIESRYEIPAMEQTSDETLSAFSKKRDLLKEKTFNNLSRILKLADLVKFAKYQPLPDEDNMTLIDAYFFVNDTKKEVKKEVSPEGPEGEAGEDVEIK